MAWGSETRHQPGTAVPSPSLSRLRPSTLFPFRKLPRNEPGLVSLSLSLSLSSSPLSPLTANTLAAPLSPFLAPLHAPDDRTNLQAVWMAGLSYVSPQSGFTTSCRGLELGLHYGNSKKCGFWALIQCSTNQILKLSQYQSGLLSTDSSGKVHPHS